MELQLQAPVEPDPQGAVIRFTLQAANLKLGSVLFDIIGGSGRAILDA